MSHNKRILQIIHDINAGKRLDYKNGLYLYKYADVALLGALANSIKLKLYGKNVYYIRNAHIEYTNICINKCAFCSFRSKSKKDAWELSVDDIFNIVKANIKLGINEIHIVGGIHPEKDIYFWAQIIKSIKIKFPNLHIKAFTAAEIHYLALSSGLTTRDALKLLKDNGLDSMPGGGAEIFDDGIREKLFPSKINWREWVGIHQELHSLGLPSNATMLYGHIESIEQRIKHLEILRNIQDKTGGFNAFIPLKFKSKNNELAKLKEVSLVEDLKMFAFSRVFLDNFKHIKAYWPMLGKDVALLSLDFGVDDLDGTINNSTSIYSKAGSQEKKPQMTAEEIIKLIKNYRKIPVERDSLYKVLS